MNHKHAEIETLLDFGEWEKAKELILSLIDPESKVYRMVKCGECGGSGEIQNDCICCATDSCALIYPCSHCENGEVKEWKTMKEIIDEGGWKSE